jgi:hypothetical protein
MDRLIVTEPSTFFSAGRDIYILDEQGNFFYAHPNKEGKINFNLPRGVYYTSNVLIKKPFVPYVKWQRPDFKYNPAEFRIVVKPNVNKASINYLTKDITIDEKIAKIKFKPLKVFLLAHELKHLDVGGSKFDSKGKMTFDAEHECDKYAENYMLSHGYNPTQIELSKKLCLSNPNRHECIHHGKHLRK